jgi:hypothetical protein
MQHEGSLSFPQEPIIIIIIIIAASATWTLSLGENKK